MGRNLPGMRGDPRGDGEAVLVAGDGVPHEHLVEVGRSVGDEHEAMAASEWHEVVVAASLQG